MNIIYIVSADWFFLSHRLPIAKHLLKSKYNVILLSKDSGSFDKIRREGIKCFDVNISRDFNGFSNEMKSIFELRKYFLKFKPDIIHSIGIKAITYSNLSSLFIKVKRINAYSGLGYSFYTKKKSIKKFIIKLLIFMTRFSKHINIFQNHNDLKTINQLTKSKKNHIILGSGVDFHKYNNTIKKPIKSPINILFPARLLIDKGIKEFLEVSKRFQRIKDLKFIVAGEPDFENINSLSKDQYIKLKKEFNHVKWCGHVNDMSQLLKSTHIVLLPTYHEGLPKALCEACIAGNIILTSDIPGCRECVEDNFNGFLFKIKDIDSIEKKINYINLNKNVLLNMSINSNIIGKKFKLNKIINQHISIYDLK